MAYFKQFSFKKFGLMDLKGQKPEDTAGQQFNDYIKVIFLKKGAKVKVDFNS